MHDTKVIEFHPRLAEETPRISLLLATIGRPQLVERFLTSVTSQGYSNLEVIVADQSKDDRVARIVHTFTNRLTIRHIHSPVGLSRARNRGLQHVTGDIVAFPDDDCVYPPGLLHSVVGRFQRYPAIGGVVGCPIDIDSGKRLHGFSSHATDLTPHNVWRLTSSIGLFLRREVTEMVGDFDESLGLGAGTPWGAGEDRDYPLRAMDNGSRIRYEPTLEVLHPRHDFRDRDLAHLYGAGLGRVLRKRGAGTYEVARLVFIRPIGGIVLSFLKLQFATARFYAHSFRGRVYGWRAPLP